MTQSCRDLISAMLVVDPLKRITIAEIRQHPWFQLNLPKYLMYPSDVSGRSIENIDSEIVREIATKFSVDKNTVLDALQNFEQGGMNEFVVAYHLINDNKGKTEKEKEKISPSLAAAILSTSPPINLRDETPFDLDEESGINDIDSRNLTYSPTGLSSTPEKKTIRSCDR